MEPNTLVLNPQRHESKLVLPATQLHLVYMWLRLHQAQFTPAFAPRWVNNIYFDTEDFSVLNDAIEGSSRRVKVRLRWSGEPSPAQRSTFELKCKLGGLGWKRSSSINTPIDLISQSWRTIVSAIRAELSPDVRIIFDQASRPTLINRYHRRYFVSFDRSVRITVDSHIRAWLQAMGMRPNTRKRCAFEDVAVLEFKADCTRTKLLSDAIHALGCRVDKHSKYATGVTGALL